MTGVTVAWSSSDGAVAAVDSTGLVRAAGAGTATVTASAGDVSGAAEVTVAQEVSAIAVSPTAARLESVDDTVRLVATPTDANGSGSSLSSSSIASITPPTRAAAAAPHA